MEKTLKEKMVNALIDDDIDTFNSGDNNDYIAMILRSGFKGYQNQSIEELNKECKERFGEIRGDFK